MAARAFEVFVDAPVAGETTQTTVSRPAPARILRSVSLTSAASDTSTSAEVIHKENFDPLTGERAGHLGAGKKRKSALVTKSTGLAKEDQVLKEKEVVPEPKKRKALASATASGSAKPRSTKVKKTRKRVASRRASPLPSVHEEEEGAAAPAGASQPEIDSRCYELTVTPLADVTEAYDEASLFRALTATPEGSPVKSQRTVRDVSVEPEIRDYFQGQTSFASSASRVLRARSADVEARAFSTPERKRIYSAFTFSSPPKPTPGESLVPNAVSSQKELA